MVTSPLLEPRGNTALGANGPSMLEVRQSVIEIEELQARRGHGKWSCPGYVDRLGLGLQAASGKILRSQSIGDKSARVGERFCGHAVWWGQRAAQKR
jgi:hypothetical protein